jgi:hypothetical protein
MVWSTAFMNWFGLVISKIQGHFFPVNWLSKCQDTGQCCKALFLVQMLAETPLPQSAWSFASPTFSASFNTKFFSDSTSLGPAVAWLNPDSCWYQYRILSDEAENQTKRNMFTCKSTVPGIEIQRTSRNKSRAKQRICKIGNWQLQITVLKQKCLKIHGSYLMLSVS